MREPTREKPWAPLGPMCHGRGFSVPAQASREVYGAWESRDSEIVRSRMHSRTGRTRVWRRWVGCEWRRQAGSGMARSRVRARLNWVSQGQRLGRCSMSRRALRVIRPAREKKRRRRVLVVATASPRAMRPVQRASNCVGCQAGWAISAGHEPRHGELSLTMAFRIVSSLRMQATKATFFGLPAASSLW